MLNCFAMGALRASDGAYLLGVMGGQSANAGRVYFPSGVPDLDDIVGDRLDLARNLRREMIEETGIQPGDLPGRRALDLRAHRLVDCDDEAAASARAGRATARAHSRDLPRDSEPELADVRIVRGPADLDALMPPFVTAYCTAMWSQAP